MKHNLLLLAALICASAETRAATVIETLPYRITAPGTYELKKNLTVNGVDGIDVNASNVSIDLGGNTLTQSTPGNGNGIFVSPGLSNVSVQNGTLAGFNTGVYFGPGSGDTLTNVQLRDIGSLGVLIKANDCLINNCTIVGATGNSATGIYISKCGGIRAVNNHFCACNYGINEYSVSKPNAFVGNDEVNCTHGLSLESSSNDQEKIRNQLPDPWTGRHVWIV